jgi:hypothetical protein
MKTFFFILMMTLTVNSFGQVGLFKASYTNTQPVFEDGTRGEWAGWMPCQDVIQTEWIDGVVHLATLAGTTVYKIDHGLNKVIFEGREQYIFRAYEDNGDKAELVFFIEEEGKGSISFFKVIKNDSVVIYKVEIVESL